MSHYLTILRGRVADDVASKTYDLDGVVLPFTDYVRDLGIIMTLD